jgi:hypothetical protein
MQAINYTSLMIYSTRVPAKETRNKNKKTHESYIPRRYGQATVHLIAITSGISRSLDDKIICLKFSDNCDRVFEFLKVPIGKVNGLYQNG